MKKICSDFFEKILFKEIWTTFFKEIWTNFFQKNLNNFFQRNFFWLPVAAKSWRIATKMRMKNFPIIVLCWCVFVNFGGTTDAFSRGLGPIYTKSYELSGLWGSCQHDCLFNSVIWIHLCRIWVIWFIHWIDEILKKLKNQKLKCWDLPPSLILHSLCFKSNTVKKRLVSHFDSFIVVA